MTHQAQTLTSQDLHKYIKNNQSIMLDVHSDGYLSRSLSFLEGLENQDDLSDKQHRWLCILESQILDFKKQQNL